MNQRFSRRHSATIIAEIRIALILLFAFWLWLHPNQPQPGASDGAIILTGYLVFAIAQLVVAKTDWWLDFLIVRPAFLIDALMLLSSIYFTEARGSDYAPFNITFYVFLIMTAAVRWSRKTTVWIAVSISFAYVVVAMLLVNSWSDLDAAKLGRMVNFLGVLMLLLAWLAMRQYPTLAPHFCLLPEAKGATPLKSALAYAMDVTGAVGGALAWANQEEPRTRLQLAGSIGSTLTQLAPGTFYRNGKGTSASELPSEGLADEGLASECVPGDSPAMLFDLERRRILASGLDDRLIASAGVLPDGLAQYLGIPTGLSFQLEGTSGRGQLILTGIPELCQDDLELGKALSREITRGLDETEMALLNHSAAVTRLRIDLARDLHDSVAQTLAGVGFRLQTLHQHIESGCDPQPEIDAATRGIQTEQDHIREMIERLRSGKVMPGNCNLGSDLAELLSGLEQQWPITARLNYSGPELQVPTAFVYEIQQLVRESVANAVRHGAAQTITVNFERSGDQLLLDIGDDGTGLDQSVGANLPKSLAERVETLAGNLAVSSQWGDTHILITVPLGK